MTRLIKFFAYIVLICAPLIVLSPGWAADSLPAGNQLNAIDIHALADGGLKITLKLNTALTSVPATFVLNSPSRIVFDLPETTNALGKNLLSVNQGALKSIQLAQSNGRSRLVFNLTQTTTHALELKDGALMLSLQGERGTPQTEPKQRFSEPVTTLAHKVQSIDFRRGRNGEGRVVIEFSDSHIDVNIKTVGKLLQIDLPDTLLPEHLQRRLDVVNFNTPVMYVDAIRQTDAAQILIEPTGDWEQSAYQMDKKLVVDIRPVRHDPNKLIQGSKQGYAGEKLSLNFQRVDVRDVLKVIADFTGKNIVVSDAVTGNVTLGLKDVPWDQALDVVLKSKGLDMRVNGNVISIAPAEEFAAKEKAQLTADNERQSLEILRTEVFTLKYQKAVDFRNMLLGGGMGSSGSATIGAASPTGSLTGALGGTTGGAGRMNRILSERGSVTFDARTNTIFIQDIPKKLEEVQSIINKIDIPVKQVMIESRMVIASNTFSKALGARFGITQSGSSGAIGGSLGNKPTAYSGGTYTLGNHGGTVQALTIGNSTVSADGNQDLMSNLPVSNAYGSVALSLLKLSANLLLNLELSALEADAKGKVISSPRVTTANQQKARIAQGMEIPYQTATSSGATAVSFKKAELSLEVTPQITPDRKIIMDLDVRKDSKGEQTSGGVAINTQNVQTQVLVGNGETVVLGGIYEQTYSNTIGKVPFFGDLPGIGFAFKRTSKQDEKSELLIFITPKIMDESLTLN